MDAHHLITVTPNPNVPDFRPGDTIRVNFRIREGSRERIQGFQGVVIRNRGGGPASTFTVRNVTRGYGVERTFPLFSPQIDSVVVTRYGKVRRARLYYQRTRFGRAARIKEGRPRGTTQVVEITDSVQDTTLIGLEVPTDESSRLSQPSDKNEKP